MAWTSIARTPIVSRCGQRARHRVTEQPRAEPPTSHGEIRLKPSQEHNPDRILRHPFDDPRSRGVAFESGSGQRVVANDAPLLCVEDHVVRA